MSKLPPLQNNLLTLGAVLGTLCLLAALAGMMLGAKPLIFRTGSMAPAIATGSLGVSVPVAAREIKTGDVVSVENSAGVRITHRVVASDVAGGAATLTLKGDANTVPDPEPYVLRKADRVVFSAPLLGYGVAWLSSPAAMFVGGLFTAYLLYVAFGPRHGKRRALPPNDAGSGKGGQSGYKEPDRQPNPGTKARHSVKRMAATLVASLALVAAGTFHTSSPGYAAFLDSTSASANFTATSLRAPTLSCANTGLNDVTLTLTHSGDPAILHELASGTPAKTWSSGPWPAGGLVSYTVDADDESFIFSQTTNVTFSGLSKISLWTSPASTRLVAYTPETNILFIGLTPAKLRCA